MEIGFETDDLPTPLPPDISLCLFRVLQEALHNSAKHSGARHFEVRLWGKSEEIHLTVRDSGTGFDIEAAKETRGLGLISMEERVKLLKGTLSIDRNIRVVPRSTLECLSVRELIPCLQRGGPSGLPWILMNDRANAARGDFQ